jgi:hypothetical protein
VSCDGNCESALRLRAQLAAVTKERDEAERERADLLAANADLLANADADALMLTQVGRERDEARELHARAVELGAAVLDNETKALKARVAALEGALALDSDLIASKDDRATLAEAVEVIEALLLDAHVCGGPYCSAPSCAKAREFLKRAKGRHG